MVHYQPGDLVCTFTPVRKISCSEKLSKRYISFYKVLRKLSDVTYELKDFEPSSRICKPKYVVHVLRIKAYHDLDSQDANVDETEIEDCKR